MNARTVRFAWYRYRASFARRVSSYLSIVLLIGVVGGLALAGVAGARRTDSSFATYLASTNPSTVALFSRYDDPGLKLNTGYNQALANEIASLPGVSRSASSVVFDGNIGLSSVKGLHLHLTGGEEPPAILGSVNGEYSSVDRVTMIAGRPTNPRSTDEAIMNVQAAHELGLHIGSTITIPIYTDFEVNSPKSFPPFRILKVTMVGEFVASRDVVESDIGSLGASAVIFSQGLTRQLAPKCSTGTETFLQLKGGDANATKVLDEVYKIDPIARHFPAEVTTSFLPVAQQIISPEAVALGIFGAISALAALLIGALMLGRLLRGGAEELEVLRALGARRSMLLAEELVGALSAVVVGSLLAVAVATGLSPLSPLGPVRSVYPDKGVSIDATVLVVGFVALVLILSSLTLLFAGREVRRVTDRRPSTPWKRESGVLRSTANSGLPIAAVTGIRFALEPGRGRAATPVRSAALGAVLAVVVLVATVTFGASLDSLVSHPPLYGWNWNYAMLSGFGGNEDLPGPQITTFLNADHYIQSWSGVNIVKASLDGQDVPAMAERPEAPVQPPILSGHGLEKANQIVLGPVTMAALGKHVGDTVTFSNGLSKPSTLTIVGTLTMPTLGNNSGLGTGALVATSRFPTSLMNLQDSSIPGPNAILVRIRPGANPAAAYRSLTQVEKKVNKIPQAQGSTGGIVKVLRPAEIVNFRSMGTTPTVLAAGLALGAIAALGLTLIASVRRRRRELALLKALGFTQRQLAASIAWQASVASIIGCVVGIPLGIIAGRLLWNDFARSINVVPSATVPALTVTLIALGALVFANLVAAIPGRTAARTPTALVLRAE
ncbi:MAG: FtsX-like permease family protein [Acidimicrobiales bacterium]